MEPFELLPGYTVRALDLPEWAELFNARVREFFANSTTIDVEAVYTDDERATYRDLNARLANMYRLQWAIEFNGQAVGWTFGHQERDGIFLMRNSAIAEGHRGKGLYTALLPRIIEHVRAAGFRLIKSQHHGSNTAVLVPKLKAGFIITGITMSDKHGVLVELTYPLNEQRREFLRYRIGESPNPLDD
jgi:GNAT superfamily N-acetyltransferase